MKSVLLYIRYRQILRILKGLGIYLPLILGTIIYLSYVSYRVYSMGIYSIHLLAILFLLCFSIQLSRKDKFFLFLHVRNFRKEIFLEYALLTLPFSFTALFTDVRYFYPAFLCLLLCLPYITYSLKKQTHLKNLSRLVPASNFEWISGIRKSYFILFPLYITALSLSWFRILPLVLCWLITVSIISFYSECEPVNILKEGGQNVKLFLRNKFIQHSKHLLLIYLPIAIINFIFNPEYYVLIPLFLLMQLVLLWFAISMKYGTYRPLQNSSANNIMASLVTLGSILPFLLPIPLLMTIYYYSKAKSNLLNYLND